MRKTLVLLAHPKFEHSVVNQYLIDLINGLEEVFIRDLYELYPDFNIDVQQEQEVLFGHDIIIWLHPIYWYAAPPLLKQWIDLVLEYGWAYGPGGIYLKNKIIFNAVSSGGTSETYSKNGKHGHTLREFLLPYEQTAKLCNMIYLPPFHIGGTHKVRQDELEKTGATFLSILQFLNQHSHIPEHLLSIDTLNDFNP